MLTENLKADVLKKIEISGNSRISSETIKVYGDIELNKDYSNDDINIIIKKLYDTKFFSKILRGIFPFLNPGNDAFFLTF